MLSSYYVFTAIMETPARAVYKDEAIVGGYLRERVIKSLVIDEVAWLVQE
jgi:hypothetical protein